MGNGERERERQREISCYRQRVLSASSSQPCISTFDPNVDGERFGRDFKKSRRAGQGTGVTSTQLNFSKRLQIMQRYGGSVKKGEGIAGHKTANIKIFIKIVVNCKK